MLSFVYVWFLIFILLQLMMICLIKRKIKGLKAKNKLIVHCNSSIKVNSIYQLICLNLNDIHTHSENTLWLFVIINIYKCLTTILHHKIIIAYSTPTHHYVKWYMQVNIFYANHTYLLLSKMLEHLMSLWRKFLRWQ